MSLAKKWFEPINQGNVSTLSTKVEIPQKEKRTKIVKGNVSATNMTIAFLMPERMHPDYYIYDLLSDILSNGKSSRLYTTLVEDKTLCTQTSAYITGTDGPGLFIIDAKPAAGVDYNTVEKEIWKILEDLVTKTISKNELQKVKNSVISHLAYSEASILSKAISLAYFEHIGDVTLINEQLSNYNNITEENVNRVCRSLFKEEKSNVLIYLPRD